MKLRSALAALGLCEADFQATFAFTTCNLDDSTATGPNNLKIGNSMIF